MVLQPHQATGKIAETPFSTDRTRICCLPVNNGHAKSPTGGYELYIVRFAGTFPATVGKYMIAPQGATSGNEWDGFPALHVALAEKAVELLKLLKLKPTIEQWFDLLKQAGWGRAEVIPAIMALQRDPDAIFRENADPAKALLRGLISSMCRRSSSRPGADLQGRLD